MMSNSSAPHEDNSSAIRQRATPVTTVHDVKQQLETYRLAKAKAYQEEKERIEKKPIEPLFHAAQATPTRARRLFDALAIDVLDAWPLRKWRQYHRQRPKQCWIITIAAWLIGLALSVHVQFGLVYALFSLFLLMFLQLGERSEGTMSAYSVFNTNCERLLGQTTMQHFERDMLMQQRPDDEN